MAEGHLTIVWTSGDKDVAKGMVFMYALNSKKHGWWKNVTFIIWGASSKLLANDRELQSELQAMIKTGVKIQACKACADMMGVADKLENMGVEVKYMGQPLTDYIKDENTHVITF